MSAVSVTCLRTVGFARNLCSTALAIGGFLSASAALFAFSLEHSEGSSLSPAVLWTMSVTPVLPLLCPVLAMDSWSEERRSGRIEMLLSLPVRERDLVFGKFLGVTAIAVVAVLLDLVVVVASLMLMAPSALAGVGVTAFLPALVALGMQCALYSAIAMAVSAGFANAMAAVTVSLAVVWAVPRGLWQALVAWFPGGAGAFGEFPMDAHAADIAGGVVSVATIAFYLLSTVAALFVANKLVFALRFSGRRSVTRKLSTAVAVVLSLASAVLITMLFARFDAVIELPPVDGQVRLSARTRGILAECRGDISVTCLVPRSDGRFRSVAHLLRALSRESAAVGGASIEVRYIDPRWDIGTAGRLAREGVRAPAIVFSNRRRRLALPLADGWGERSCASALLRLTVPPSRNAVYWTVGHGESSFSDYDASGMSDIARELARDGYRNFSLDLASEAKIPSDCALIAVAGAKREFSRAELARLDAYLRQGGRLLVLADGSESALLSSLMPAWGAIAREAVVDPGRTLTGTDAVVSDFGPHLVSASLRGSQIVLDRPVRFSPSAAVGVATGADRIEFSVLAGTESQAVAVMLERGAGVGSDTAIRPTRIALIGDALFVGNAQLEFRANANRDFFLNCISYLSGSHAITSGGVDGGIFTTGLDRRGRLRMLKVSAIWVPLAVVALMLLVAWRRGSRR